MSEQFEVGQSVRYHGAVWRIEEIDADDGDDEDDAQIYACPGLRLARRDRYGSLISHTCACAVRPVEEEPAR